MTIDGIKKFKTKKVSLDEFFDIKTKGKDTEPHVWVEVRPLPPFTSAEIDELRFDGMEFRADQSSRMKVPAETRLLIRKKKLGIGIGVVDHSITADGAKADWNEDLWKELDACNPRILRKIEKAIDDINAVEEGAVNPF